MRVTSLIENTSRQGLPVEHGLSLFIQKDDGQQVLFDMGQGTLFAQNAAALGLSLADVDVAVVSHGHYDHGGGLATFLGANSHAPVFIHEDAFQPHYSLRETGLRYIGLDPSLCSHPRLVPCAGPTGIGAGMTLFADVQGSCCSPVGNRLLFGPREEENDLFGHEQNLLIEEGRNVVLFAGCAHRGIINILHKAKSLLGKTPTHVFAGMHLVKSGLSPSAEDAFIRTLAAELQRFRATRFYTMHCTGEEQYLKLHALMGDQICYMSCGDEETIAADRS